MEQKQHSSGFLNGLLLGFVLGAGLVLLLTTKKGKQVLRTISEDGLDSITDWDELYKKLEKALSEPEDQQPAPKVEPKLIATPVIKPDPETVEETVTQQVVSEAPVMKTPEVVSSIVRKTEPVQTEPIPVSRPEPEVVKAAPQPVVTQTQSQQETVDEEKTGNDSVPSKPRIIAVDRETSEKLAEMQARLDREIHAVSEAIANNYIPYADDDLEDEEETPKVKQTRRRFFRGIPRRA